MIAEYMRRGWALVPVPAGSKAAIARDWNTRTFGPGDFAPGCNVSLMLGPRSGEIVDIDLDCPEALALADRYLPPTGAEFGRASKPRSHRLYTALGATFDAFADPLDGTMLVEERAQGREGGAHLTLLPPSVTDGERREWHSDTIAPTVYDAAKLHRRAAWLAVGCLVMRHVSPTAARNPKPDLPRLLYEADPQLGRAAYRWLGQLDPEAPQHHLRPRRELTREEIDLAELVNAIPNRADWTAWNRIGLALFSASGGSSQGGVVFDDWSSKSPKYDPHVTAARWRHYRRSPPDRIGIGTLIHLAREAGWHRPDAAAA